MKDFGWQNRPFLAFVHIEKAAGTTFIHVLRRNLFMRYLDVRPLSSTSNGMFTARDLEICMRLNPMLLAFGGHSVRPLGDLCERFPQIRFVSIVRNPVRRYISQFLYGNAVLKLNLNFEHFLQDERTHNFQTKKIAGEADLQCAKNIIKNRFIAIGMVEQIDRFLSVLSSLLSPRHFEVEYEARNVGSYSREEEELLERHESEICAVNQVDADLYSHVEEVCSTTYRQLQGDDRSASEVGYLGRCISIVDFALRKAYYEPATGLIRKWGGLPMKGSY